MNYMAVWKNILDRRVSVCAVTAKYLQFNPRSSLLWQCARCSVGRDKLGVSGSRINMINIRSGTFLSIIHILHWLDEARQIHNVQIRMMYVLWKIVRGQPEFDRSLGNETHAVIPAVYVHMCLVVGSWSAVPHMQLQAVLKIQGMVSGIGVHPCRPWVVWKRNERDDWGKW